MKLSNNFDYPDDFYNSFIDAHKSLTDEQSEQFNLSLIFILANHIGNTKELKRLLEIAVASVRTASEKT